MAEEDEKKKIVTVEETPKIERPPIVSKETPTKMPETPPISSPPVLESLPEKIVEEPSCQWFMNDMNFCDKTKKIVKCKGDVSNCPFCR